MITSFAPNNTAKDVLNCIGYLMFPWRWFTWKKGPYPQKVQEKLAEILNVKSSQIIAFDSGRTALYEVLKAYNIGQNDEVLMQAFTCAVVANAIIYTGATPIYLDIEATTYNIDPQKIEQKITAKTKAIIIQHTFGFAADIQAIQAIATRHNLIVIEDCAHSLGGNYQGQKLGTFADASIFSFGVDKVISSVRGGAAYARDPKIVEKLQQAQKALPQMGIFTIRKHLQQPLLFAIGKFLYPIFIGKIWLYLCKKLHFTPRVVEDSEKRAKKPFWFPVKIPNALANLAYYQLLNLEQKNEHRRTIAKFYEENLPQGFTKPTIMPESSPIYLRYPLQSENRNQLHQKAKNAGIFLGDWYDTAVAPKDTDLKAIKYEIGSCPVSEETSRKVFNLPTHHAITLKKAQKIVDLLK